MNNAAAQNKTSFEFILLHLLQQAQLKDEKHNYMTRDSCDRRQNQDFLVVSTQNKCILTFLTEILFWTPTETLVAIKVSLAGIVAWTLSIT